MRNKRNKSRTDVLRRVLIVVLFAMLVGLFYGAFSSRNPQRNGRKIIAIAKTRDFSVAFWASVKNGMEEAGREFSAQVEYRAPLEESDIDGQIAMLDKAIADKPDAILLAASDQHRLLEPVLRAGIAGIPVIMFDSSIDSGADAPFETFVATDNVKAGELLAAAILESVQEDGKIAIISHNVNTTSGYGRERGIRNIIDSRFDVLPTVDCEGSRDTAVTEAERLLQNEDLAAIVCTNEYTTSATLDALERYPRPDLILVGFDTSYQMMDALESGVLKATVIQRAFNMGYLSVEKTIQYLNKEALDPFYDSTSALITRDVMYREENEQLLFPFNPIEP